ncbi:putative nitroreductase [Nocardia nova SH22a]|uniref:Putative nitroreductase n=1 Tax=Nocardia nova SH22a TaxID=1415166 RepID=W5T8U7_9NOCA|nr:nitroreductase [Nocardia nova]AHH15559.1 putative nitroreductase [Nocardia nova SH22a]
MDIYSAVHSRRAVRAFTSDPVPPMVLRRVLSAATRAPSGANLQPWKTFVVTGTALDELKQRTGERVDAADPEDKPEYRMYPPDLPAPYRDRRAAAAEQRYSALGIHRADTRARAAHVAENWKCFGASTALFCYVDRLMGPPQWADLGMYLQTVMLLLRAEGLHSCTQMAWSMYHRTVAEVVCPPDDSILFCGMSIGFEDTAAAHPRIDRAPLGETVTFVDATVRHP